MTARELESGRGWVLVSTAVHLVQRDRRTVRRWCDAGYVRTRKEHGRVLVNLEELMAAEAAFTAGDTPERAVDNNEST